MIRQATADKLAHKLYLFYTNNRPEDAAFIEDLQVLAHMNQDFDFIPTMTDMARSSRSWHGETRFISGEMLLGRLSNLHGPIYYMAGPPGMVVAMRTLLLGTGVDEDDIRTKEFAGY